MADEGAPLRSNAQQRFCQPVSVSVSALAGSVGSRTGLNIKRWRYTTVAAAGSVLALIPTAAAASIAKER